MTMEVEAKAHCKDLKAVESRILDLGAHFLWEGTQKDTYFNHPGRDFALTDEALRIREVGDKAYLTYKGPKIDAITKTREEIAVPVDDSEALSEVLKKLGFQEVRTVTKNRQKYQLKEFTICLDKVEDLGDFVELEAICDPSDSQRIEELRNTILNTLNDWNLTKIERKSYLELLLKNEI
jgi:adenylate cyclase class 2